MAKVAKSDSTRWSLFTTFAARYQPISTLDADALWRVNNFDLIRLLAAAQVAILHGISWFGMYSGLRPIVHALSVFPGVPIFFFVSGMLISRAYLRTSPRLYLRNRCLRIFPLLWVSMIFTLTLVFVNPNCGASASTGDWLGWWFANMTLGQNWQPEFLGASCVATPVGGGRWTIAVELSFYLLLPLLLMALRRIGRLADAMLIGIALASAAFELWVLNAESLNRESLLLRYLHVSLPTFLWTFTLGVLAHRHFAALVPWVRGKTLLWLAAYVGATALAYRAGWRVQNNEINAASFVVLAGLVLSIATTWPALSERLLHRNDFSYGLYLFHIPLMILARHFVPQPDYWTIATWLVVSAAFAVMSWFLLERPFLRRKEDSAYARAPGPALASPDYRP